MVIFLTSTLLKGREDFAKIWLAAHWERKLKRCHIYKVDIEGIVSEMINRDITLDLRLSGHLLIGIVKIFSRKTKYLLNECSDIFLQVKTYRSINEIDLPANRVTACLRDITFPELKNIDEFIQVNNKEQEGYQSRCEEITLKETFGTLAPEEDECEMGPQDENFSQELEDEILKSFEEYKKGEKRPKRASNQMIQININCEKMEDVHDAEDDLFSCNEIVEEPGLFEDPPEKRSCHASICIEPISIHPEHLKLLSNEELNLEPLTEMVIKTSRRKRKLIIDEINTLDPVKLRDRLSNTSDIMIPFEMAPPTKRLMTLKEIGCVEKLFKLPCNLLRNSNILNLYTRNLKNHKLEEQPSSCDEETFTWPSPEQPRAAPAQNEDFNQCIEMSEVCNFEDMNEANRQDVSPPVREEFVLENIDGDKCHQDNSVDLLQNEISYEDSQTNLEKRVSTLLISVQSSLRKNKELKFSEMVHNEKRIKVARKFQTLLMLKKLNAIELKQIKPYEEIFVSKGSSFSPACSQLIQ